MPYKNGTFFSKHKWGLSQTPMLAVKQKKKLMDVVSMYWEKLKESQAEVASNEVSQSVLVKSIKRMSVMLHHFWSHGFTDKEFYSSHTNSWEYI
jgi:GTP cyclohydrolase I